MSIHQPRYSIFKMFDTISLLSNGEFVYQGPAVEAIPYFEDLGNFPNCKMIGIIYYYSALVFVIYYTSSQQQTYVWSKS